jgi:hypothetical protein
MGVVVESRGAARENVRQVLGQEEPLPDLPHRRLREETEVALSQSRASICEILRRS